MKKSDAMATMTNKVSELLADGWNIAFDLRGTYSNIAGYMTFARGDRRAIVYVEETPDYGAKVGKLRVACAEIVLGKEETLERNYLWPTDWDKHITEERAFYKVANWDGDWYGTEEEAKKAEEVRRARWNARHTYMTRKEFKVTERVMSAVHKVVGFKTIKAENVKVYRIERTYYIENTKSGRVARYSL